tara:strand:- start:1999 stop:2451 length:453 start_codon:yes stop_codon:yes gene_type:complete
MAEQLTYDDVVEKLEADGIMQEPDASWLLEYINTEYGGSLDTESSWSENKHSLKIYSESTADGYDIFWCTHDEKPYVCQDGYQYEDYQAWSEQAIEELTYGGNVYIESHIWDDMEYDFNYELETWWQEVYEDLHKDKVDELIDEGYEYED